MDHDDETADSYLHFKLDLREPVELKDFVSLLGALSSQYEVYAKQNSPSEASEGQFYIKEIRPGCIEGELFPKTADMIRIMDEALIVQGFLKLIFVGVGKYFRRGGRYPNATKKDLKDFRDVVEAVANDPNGSLLLEARSKKGIFSEETVFRFDTAQARVAREEIALHEAELSRREGNDLKNVLMTFYQPNLSDADKSGEKAIVEATGSRRPLAVHWVSDLAKGAIKTDLRDGKAFKLGFYVDVTVDRVNGRPAVYQITGYHGTVELDDGE
jgi:hypothetical protein